MSKTQIVAIVMLSVIVLTLMLSLTGLAMLNTELESVVGGNVLIINGSITHVNPGEILYINKETYDVSYGLPGEDKCHYVEDGKLYYDWR